MHLIAATEISAGVITRLYTSLLDVILDKKPVHSKEKWEFDISPIEDRHYQEILARVPSYPLANPIDCLYLLHQPYKTP